VLQGCPARAPFSTVSGNLNELKYFYLISSYGAMNALLLHAEEPEQSGRTRASAEVTNNLSSTNLRIQSDTPCVPRSGVGEAGPDHPVFGLEVLTID
jgi:hypothetical protein